MDLDDIFEWMKSVAILIIAVAVSVFILVGLGAATHLVCRVFMFGWREW